MAPFILSLINVRHYETDQEKIQPDLIKPLVELEVNKPIEIYPINICSFTVKSKPQKRIN